MVPVLLITSLTLADVDDENLDAATVQITTGYPEGWRMNWDLQDTGITQVGQRVVVVVGTLTGNEGSYMKLL